MLTSGWRKPENLEIWRKNGPWHSSTTVPWGKWGRPGCGRLPNWIWLDWRTENRRKSCKRCFWRSYLEGNPAVRVLPAVRSVCLLARLFICSEAVWYAATLAKMAQYASFSSGNGYLPLPVYYSKRSEAIKNIPFLTHMIRRLTSQSWTTTRWTVGNADGRWRHSGWAVGNADRWRHPGWAVGNIARGWRHSVWI